MSRATCFRCKQTFDAPKGLRVLAGVCAQCLTTLAASRDEQMSAYLESFDTPAALLAPDLTVLLSNSSFRRLRTDGQATGLRVGEVLDCMYTQTLGRCGETVACLLCRLRRSVERTLRTAENLRGESLSYPHAGHSRAVFTVATEKIGDSVLVLLEPS